VQAPKWISHGSNVKQDWFVGTHRFVSVELGGVRCWDRMYWNWSSRPTSKSNRYQIRN